ncbi:hypothetical protein GCM10029976_068130 [Kribbella albertanoniae]
MCSRFILWCWTGRWGDTIRGPEPQTVREDSRAPPHPWAPDSLAVWSQKLAMRKYLAAERRFLPYCNRIVSECYA